MEIREASGLAISRRNPGLLWVHNDSGGQPLLHAIEPNGTYRGAVRIEGARNIDWEDIASFELDGKPWLLIADTGDNAGKGKNRELLVVAEPDPASLDPLKETSATVAWKIPVRYADGPRDCEAVAVEAKAGLVYLLSKRDTPPRLYTLPLRPAAANADAGTADNNIVAAAKFVAQIKNLPQPEGAQLFLDIPSGRYRAQPTSMDFAADGSMAVILTYGDVLLFTRNGNESWADTLQRKPTLLPPHTLLQAEAISFNQNATALHVAGEGLRTAVLRYRLPPR